MTAYLVSVLGRAHGSVAGQLVLALLVAILLPLMLLLDGVSAFVRTSRVRSQLARPVLRCPRGHAVVVQDADALWNCGACGFSYLGHGLAPCPRCGAVAGFLTCACGAALPNPVFDILEGR